MELSRTVIQIWSADRCRMPGAMRSGVSLHSHSNASKEKLSFIPSVVRRLPIVRRHFEGSLATYERRYGRPFDFSMGFWRPPLGASEVIASERQQIEERFDLQGLVSVTDHDTVDGVWPLRAGGRADVPISLEWTAPYDGVVFHLGIHNIAPARLEEMRAVLANYTAHGTPSLGAILDWLNESDDTLVVLNHPYWDLTGVGAMRHDSVLLAFMRAHRDRLHALELNGYRTWHENRRVLPLAEGFALPLVTGGDRHGFAPNALLNLTASTTLAEFAHEVRSGRTTHCVVLPEYLEPHNARVLSSAADLIQARRRGNIDGASWKERVFVPSPDGALRPVGELWGGAPWVSATIAVVCLLSSSHLHPLFELVRNDGRQTLEMDCGHVMATESGAVLDIVEPAGAA